MNLIFRCLTVLGPVFACLLQSASATSLTPQQQPSAKAFEAMRYGNFTHIVYGLSIGPDGTKPKGNLEEFVKGFDVKAYADSMKAFGVEYVIFTAWHKAMYCLGPNAVLEKSLPGHTCNRDLLGEIADALGERGIKMIIYAHPNDGHDLNPEEKKRVGFVPPQKGVSRLMPKFNDFINEVYAETAARMSKHPNVIGFWWDSWNANGHAIDMPRLRASVLGAMPRAIILSNNDDPRWIDFLSLERYYIRGPKGNIDNLIARDANQCTIFAGNWWCSGLQERSLYSPETLFQFTAFNACTGAPGGMAWSISPTCDGKTWATDNLQTMKRVNQLIGPVASSIHGVTKSLNWPVPNNTLFSKSVGYGATRSIDGSHEYLHVFRSPQGPLLEIPAGHEHFGSARLLANGHAVSLESNGSHLRFTLGSGDHWDPLDTVIELDRSVSPAQQASPAKVPSGR